ncbi:MAG: hypothetical protein K2X25_16655 [Caulobacteraceae bacterium]|nr:hypothetical protein [Caulobacteraceae bacterium]
MRIPPVLAILTAVCVLIAPASASAEWRRAESPQFIVYSTGSERALRDYVQKLETFDRILRQRLRLRQGEPAVRKFPIYLVEGRRGLAEVFPGLNRDIAGIYSAAEEDIFATAIRNGDDDIMLHEYTHHFMFQNAPGSYPGWLVEGFAEYHATARISEGRVEIGRYSEARASWLVNSPWIPLEELLSKRPGEVRRGTHQSTYYPVAWLLTHWFLSDAGRRTQLQTYVEAVAAGGDPVEAMEQSTGLTLDQLRGALRSYMRERIQITRYTAEFREVEITVTTLPASADDLLLIGQRLKVGVPQDQRLATAEEVRRLAARHPDDPFAMLQLGHAELHFGDPDAGEAVLTRLLEREPENVEALQLLATRFMKLATEAQDARPLLNRARGYLARANAINDSDYYTLLLLGETRRGASNYPNDNDIATWAFAFEAAPQLAATRLGYASVLMLVDRFDDAITLLQPLATSPHGGGAADAAQTMLELAESRRPPLTEAEIEAAVEAGEDQPEDGEDTEQTPTPPA